MNTNLLIVTLITLSTNWTGHFDKDRELGYVVTNHVVEVRHSPVETNIVYDGSEPCPTIAFEWGQTNRFVLQSVPSDRAVWRERPRTNSVLIDGTNIWFQELPWITNWISSNYLNVQVIEP